jgi:putative adhesin
MYEYGKAGERGKANMVRKQRNQRGRMRVGWVLLVLALALPALASENQQRVVRDGNGWIQESSGPLASEKSLQVTRFVGSVQVVAGAQSGSYILRLRSEEPLEKDARQQFNDYHLGVGRRSGEVLIQTVGPIDMAVRAELILQIPSNTEAVHVDTLAGKITIQGSVDHLDLKTHGGDIELDDAQLLHAVTLGGSITVNHRVGDSLISSGGGDIHVDASVGDLEISSLGGNIYLKAIARGRVESGGGNIEVVRCMGALMVHTAGGNINLGEMDGDVTAETGGGNIRVGVAHGEVVARTAQGNIELWKLSKGADAHTGRGRITAEFVGDRNSTRNSELVTSMGDIVAYFAGTTPGNLHAVAGSCPARRILSEFPELKISNGIAEYGPRSVAADGAIHGGGPMIDMRTMIGQIELRNIR